MDWIEAELEALADTDDAYRTFNARIVATADPATMLGVRVPKLRTLTQKILRSKDREAFLDELPHRFYEENLLHAFVLNEEKELSVLCSRLERFLPLIDNWCVCDALAPKALKRAEKDWLEALARGYMASDLEYTRRFGISLLMRDLLPHHFAGEQLLWAAEADDGRYYVEMMVGWYLAEALVTQKETVFPFIAEGPLGAETRRIAIQKAIESRRIPEETKERLRALRRRQARNA